jgi:hypothetical protein
MEDKLVKCDNCGSEMCYAHPINETAWAYSCTGCGFTANDLLLEGEYDVEKFEESFPELYKDIKYTDKTGKVWYPLVMHTDAGVVFIDGTDKDNWGWAAIRNRPLTPQEIDTYAKENKPMPNFKSDSSTLKHFGKLGFLSALSYIGMA